MVELDTAGGAVESPDGRADASYPVGQVAAFAHVTIRTLHHYDEIGLLVPGERTPAGYRRYVRDDLARLQRILFYRELGFGLEEITTILDDRTPTRSSTCAANMGCCRTAPNGCTT